MTSSRKISLLAVLAIGGVIVSTGGLSAPAHAVAPTCAVGQVSLDDITYNLAADCTATVGLGTAAPGVLVIPSTVTSSGEAYSVTSILSAAFEFLAISSLSLPSSLTSIGSQAFRSMSLSGTLDFSALTSLASIGSQAFEGNTAVTRVVLPASLTSIGAFSFDRTSITDATFLGDLPATGSTDSFPTATVLHYCGAPNTWFGFEVVSGNCFVTFDSTGGTSVPAEVVAYGATLAAPSSPTRSGYVFAGWVTSQGGDVPFPFGTGATSNASVYASWVEAPVIPAELSRTGIDSSTIGGLTLLLLALGASTVVLNNRSKRRTM